MNYNLIISPQEGSSKRGLAPRSTLQYKEGPKFNATKNLAPVHISDGSQVFPEVSARLDRGFDMVNNEWIGYKRNYFTLITSVQFPHLTFDEFLNEKYSTVDIDGFKRELKQFRIRVKAYCAETGDEVRLIQHTAKRDKGPQMEPGVIPIVPGVLPLREFVIEGANIKSKKKMAMVKQRLFYDKSKCNNANGILKNYPPEPVAQVATYERMQFATSVYSRVSPHLPNHFIIKVELIGITISDEFEVLAHTETPPLIIRGRSPSNYGRNYNIIPKNSKDAKTETVALQRNFLHDLEPSNASCDNSRARIRRNNFTTVKSELYHTAETSHAIDSEIVEMNMEARGKQYNQGELSSLLNHQTESASSFSSYREEWKLRLPRQKLGPQLKSSGFEDDSTEGIINPHFYKSRTYDARIGSPTNEDRFNLSDFDPILYQQQEKSLGQASEEVQEDKEYDEYDTQELLQKVFHNLRKLKELPASVSSIHNNSSDNGDEDYTIHKLQKASQKSRTSHRGSKFKVRFYFCKLPYQELVMQLNKSS